MKRRNKNPHYNRSNRYVSSKEYTAISSSEGSSSESEGESDGESDGEREPTPAPHQQSTKASKSKDTVLKRTYNADKPRPKPKATQLKDREDAAKKSADTNLKKRSLAKQKPSAEVSKPNDQTTKSSKCQPAEKPSKRAKQPVPILIPVDSQRKRLEEANAEVEMEMGDGAYVQDSEASQESGYESQELWARKQWITSISLEFLLIWAL